MFKETKQSYENHLIKEDTYNIIKKSDDDGTEACSLIKPSNVIVLRNEKLQNLYTYYKIVSYFTDQGNTFKSFLLDDLEKYLEGHINHLDFFKEKYFKQLNKGEFIIQNNFFKIFLGKGITTLDKQKNEEKAKQEQKRENIKQYNLSEEIRKNTQAILIDEYFKKNKKS